jgi:hypothetical protein
MKYRYEYEMCDDFMRLNNEDFDIYPECYGYDMLMFSKTDEIQIGVQAKLKNNLKAIYQILNNTETPSGTLKRRGPHFRAILTPYNDDDKYSNLCSKIRILKMHVSCITTPIKYFKSLGINQFSLKFIENYKRPIIRLNDSPGKSSPKNLSAWRINALKAMAEYYDTGYILSSKLRELGLNPTIFMQWFEYRFLEPKVGRCHKMMLKDENHHPANGYETELEEIKKIIKKG